MARSLAREQSPSWRGGRKFTGNGYVSVLVGNQHPRATPAGYVLEHVLVVERALGHFLARPAVIHHRDDNGLNNAPTNLVVCQDQSYHKLLHIRRDAYRASGNPNYRRCSLCSRFDDTANMATRADRRNPIVYIGYVHHECRRAYMAVWHAKERR